MDGAIGRVKAVSSIFQWTINDIFSEGKGNNILKSPFFITQRWSCPCEEDEWQLLLHTIERKPGVKDLAFTCLETVSEVKVSLQFFFLNSMKQPFFTSNILTHSFNKLHKMIDCATCVKNELLIDPQLTILCKISFAENFIQQKLNEDNVFDRKRLVEFDQFENMLNDRQFSDVVFNIDGQKIHAHKNIVSNRCPAFKAMFQHDMKENKTNEVHIDDIEYEVFNELLRYTYAGRINNLSTIAYKLLIAADKYSLETLKELCETALCNDLTIHNAIIYLQLADTYTAKILKCKAIDFIVNNRKVMNKMPTFKEIEDLPSYILSKLISSLMDAPSNTS